MGIESKSGRTFSHQAYTDTTYTRRRNNGLHSLSVRGTAGGKKWTQHEVHMCTKNTEFPAANLQKVPAAADFN